LISCVFYLFYSFVDTTTTASCTASC